VKQAFRTLALPAVLSNAFLTAARTPASLASSPAQASLQPAQASPQVTNAVTSRLLLLRSGLAVANIAGSGSREGLVSNAAVCVRCANRWE